MITLALLLALLFGTIIVIGILVLAGALALAALPVLLLLVTDIVAVCLIIRAIFCKKNVKVIEEKGS